MEVDIGIGKNARRGYGLEEIAIVPTRRTRDADDVDLTWELDAYRFSVPMMSASMDSTMSPATVVEVGKLGGLGVLNLQGLWTRYQDPAPIYTEIAAAPPDRATAILQDVYRESIKVQLIGERIQEIVDSGVISAASLTPQNTLQYASLALEAGLDLLVIQGTVVSAEHVSIRTEPLNLKKFIAESPIPVVVGGCSSYSMALHLMRTGAVGVLVGVGPGAASATRGVLGVGLPQATGYRRRGRRQSALFAGDGALCACHRRWGNENRGGGRQGNSLWSGRGDAGFSPGGGPRSARFGVPLGNVGLPRLPAPRRPD